MEVERLRGRAIWNTNPLLSYLRVRGMFDARGYALAPLHRRALRRIRLLGCSSVADYMRRLDLDPDEAGRLVNSLLGRPTGFARDGAVWRSLATLLARTIAKDPPPRVRVWSAGCSTGEEALTLAMLFAEGFGLESLSRTVEIVATDIDPAALETARRGVYAAEDVALLPPEAVASYFDERDGVFVVREALRRSIFFARQDLLTDRPLPGMDLVVCRDVLRWFSRAGQRRALRSLVNALRPGALLVLGRQEWPLQSDDLETVDPVHRIYRRSSLELEAHEPSNDTF